MSFAIVQAGQLTVLVLVVQPQQKQLLQLQVLLMNFSYYSLWHDFRTNH